jgi:hypothetical protein
VGITIQYKQIESSFTTILVREVVRFWEKGIVVLVFGSNLRRSHKEYHGQVQHDTIQESRE